jgi:hypothetical protein
VFAGSSAVATPEWFELLLDPLSLFAVLVRFRVRRAPALRHDESDYLAADF